MLPDTNNHDGASSDLDVTLYDEIMCIADTKSVLAGWYMVNLPNGRGIPDWNSLCAMIQDHYGHARALYQFLGRYGLTREHCEQRPAVEMRSARLLDSPPESWSDFVVTMFLAEHLLSALLGGYRGNHRERALAGLADKMEREARFHRSYAIGWLQALATDDAPVLESVLRERYPVALEWWGPGEGSDPVLDGEWRSTPESDLRDIFVEAVTADLRDAGLVLPEVTAAPTGEPWLRATRRSGPPGIPETLHELISFKYVEFAVP
jgi:1,2-phenylacetyl-CoA epoxidase catalytic subunit